MGSFIKISCKNCEWANSGALGRGGNNLAKLENCFERLPASMQEKITAGHSGDGDIKGFVSFTAVLTSCSNCQEIEFRKYATVHVFDLNFPEPIVTEFNCKKCNLKTKEVEKEARPSLHCPECNNPDLQFESFGIWD